MDDAEAIELIDAHLDRQPLTDEQADALTAWIKADPKRADEAFYRIFLHSYLRVRLQAGILPGASDLSVLNDSRLDALTRGHAALMVDGLSVPIQKKRFGRRTALIVFIACSLVVGVVGWVGWSISSVVSKSALNKVYAYEGFDYPATVLPKAEKQDFQWPTSGGLQGLAGGLGWSEPWQETNSKVAVIVDYAKQEVPWEPKDMRKFGPLGYTDSRGNVLQSLGHQLRTATSPRSITTRRFNISAFPDSMQGEGGLGRDGSVIWFSFLAQSSLSTADNNRYSYLVIGTKSMAGLRVGKLGATPSGNWTAAGLLTGAEVNLRSSTVPSGEVVLLVTRIVFRPGPEDAVVWINPPLDAEPSPTAAAMRLPVPDFRFVGISIHANHSTDFDEIRFGGTFQSVAPIR
ncbi:MAG: hypothetical protein JWN70_3901 [Planctomycetaceae bacterium]|nr:hypothetical protein [Planctomycetaceae bacterium]